MTVRRKRLVLLGITIVAVGSLAALGIWPMPRSTPSSSTLPRATVAKGYVSDAVCAECHADLAARFKETPMGQAWAHWTTAIPIETPKPDFARQVGDLLYTVEQDENRLVQCEYRVDSAGGRQLLQRHPIDYVLGSGAHGRAYVRSENGYLTVMPLGWYSNRAIFDMNPGYDVENRRFSRPIVERCVECHTVKSAFRPGSLHGFEEPLDDGIGCQRCHGPGKAHVDLHRSGKTLIRREDDPIVHLASLPPARRQDVCLQCHFQGDVSLAKPGRQPSAFVPGMTLSELRSDFVDLSRAAEFRAIGHGPRSMASACYQKSGGKMTCAYCHPPHRMSASIPLDVYNQRCLDCHQQQPCNRPLETGATANSGNCVACHMPKRKAADIPHASSTDHWIHRPGQAATGIWETTPEPTLASLWPDESKGQLGSALVLHFGARAMPEKVREGLRWLDEALKSEPEVAQWQYYKGMGHYQLGEYDKAVPVLARARERAPDVIDICHTLAEALDGLGAADQALEVRLQTLERFPWNYLGDLRIAQRLSERGEFSRLLELEERFFRHHPADGVRLELVARAMERLQRPAADIDRVVEQAIAADPARSSPYLMQAARAAKVEAWSRVEQSLRLATRVEPSAIVPRLALARYLGTQRRFAEAMGEVQMVLAIDPQNREAKEMLRVFGHSAFPAFGR